MGNHSSTSSFWPAGKLFNRDRKQKGSKKGTTKHRESKKSSPVAPMYDTVADFPVYAVVDKSRPKNNAVEENVQYAEIEVVRNPTKPSQNKPALAPKPAETTEYATINFPPQNNSTNTYKAPPGVPRKYNAANGTLV